MSKAMMILVAVGVITGGIRHEKTKEFTPATLGDGEELTAKAASALGLDDAAIEQLRERGALIEISARLADSGEAADPALGEAQRQVGELTSERDQLRAKVSELEQELDTAKKAAAKA